MGIHGIPSRVGSLLSGAFCSYASIADQTAPGQVKIDEFLEYLDLLHDHNDFKNANNFPNG